MRENFPILVAYKYLMIAMNLHSPAIAQYLFAELKLIFAVRSKLFLNASIKCMHTWDVGGYSALPTWVGSHQSIFFQNNYEKEETSKMIFNFLKCQNSYFVRNITVYFPRDLLSDTL